MSQSSDLWVNQSLDTCSGTGDNSAENFTPDNQSLLTFLCRSLAVLWKEWSKHMNLTELQAESGKFSLRGDCPHCQTAAVFIQITNVHVEQVDSYLQRLAVGMQCQGCLEYILAIALKNASPAQRVNLRYVAHYPLGKPDDSVDSNVPRDIAADFAEALRCEWVGSYKAAVAMCRRSVEAACKDLGAKGKDLYQKIENLAEAGIITDFMRRMAHQVRLTANRKLHDKAKAAKEVADEEFEADDLEQMKEKDATAMIKFTKEFFHHVYALRALLDEYENSAGEASDGS